MHDHAPGFQRDDVRGCVLHLLVVLYFDDLVITALQPIPGLEVDPSGVEEHLVDIEGADQHVRVGASAALRIEVQVGTSAAQREKCHVVVALGAANQRVELIETGFRKCDRVRCDEHVFGEKEAWARFADNITGNRQQDRYRQFVECPLR